MRLYITDKTGKRFFRVSVAAQWSQGERNNVARKLKAIQAGDKAYAFIDRDSASMVEELEPGEVNQ